MKGKISKKLEEILRDPSARTQLRNILIHGEEGTIRLDEDSYKVSRATTSIDLGKSETPTSQQTNE